MRSVRDDILLFLQRPLEFAASVEQGDQELWRRGLTDFAQPRLAAPGQKQLREAQVRAWTEIAPHRVSLVLGPPGTGKSAVLAWMAAGYIHARRAAGLTGRVLVAGFTRESMGNLLDKFTSIAGEHLHEVPAAFIGNAPDGALDRNVAKLPLRTRQEREKARQFLAVRHSISAINGWQLARLLGDGSWPDGDGHTASLFDLILIDEASQMPVSQGLMALAGLAGGGRVIVAGDDKQLGPVRATFEATAEGGRAIGESLYTFLKSANVKEVVLEETFRLNAPLVAFPSEHLYDGRFRSAVPDRRLPLRENWDAGLQPWQRVALHPEFPVVVLLHDGPLSGTENPFERHLIRSLVEALADRLPPGHAGAMDEHTFWNERLAVITPHRAQNAALREELAVVPLGRQARVETVDRFQGRERDVIIAGYTVADPEFAQQEAEFLFGFERLNVTVTRSRHKLILLVSRRLLEVLPADEDVFDDAQLLREYLLECRPAGAVSLANSDGATHAVEVRVRGFEPTAADAAAVMLGEAVAESTDATESSAPRGRVIRLTYAADEVSAFRVRKGLELDRHSYTYIVATAALKRRRRDEGGFAPHQRDRESDDAVLLFREVLEELFPGRALSRTGERVYLKRAIAAALKDPEVASLVQHDLFPWLEALNQVAERGLDLSKPPAPGAQEAFLSEAVEKTLRTLQQAHRSVRPEKERPTFEEAANALLEGRLAVGDRVVMEGFTFLTRLQRRFVRACLDQGKTVCFVHPYNPSQKRAFAIMERTYDEFESKTTRIHLEDESSAVPADDLKLLGRRLFADDAAQVPSPAPPSRVALQVFSHRHDEVEACMRWIREYSKDAELKTFAIVTRNPSEFDSLVQEQARIYGVRNRIGREPRRLLLTPIGRFALTLFEIRREGTLEVLPDHFETMLASGWLGSDLQGTADLFSAVRPQVFDLCRSRENWQRAFDLLEQPDLHFEDSRLPSKAVTKPILARWRTAFERVDLLSERLFTGPEDQSISGRVRQLLDELERLDPGNLRATEREIIVRIRDVLTEVAQGGGMAVSGTEFGEILNSLVKEYDRDETEDAPPAREEDETDASAIGRKKRELPHVWVTSPESIDSHPVDVVFYLGVDDKRVPRAAPGPWPFFEDTVERSQKLDRYLFLAVVRATQKRLHLSYSQRGEGESYAASTYFSEVESVLDRKAEEPKLLPALAVPPPEPTLPAAPAQRTEYALHEVAIAGLCPYRYKLERLDETARFCRDNFQLRFIAQGVWLEAIYEEAKGRRAEGEKEIAKALLQAMEATEAGVRAMFPALRTLQWEPVRTFVERNVLWTAQYFGTRPYHVAIEDVPPGMWEEIRVNGHTVQVKLGLQHSCRVGTTVREPLTTPILHREWMLPKLPEDEKDGRFLTKRLDRLVFENQYKAIRWWSSAARRLMRWKGLEKQPNNWARPAAEAECQELRKELAVLVRQIETGHYPKNIGAHCRYCPVRSVCLAAEEWQGEPHISGAGTQ